MPILKPLSDSELGADLLADLQFFCGTLGGIPNSVRTMARRPRIVEAFTELNKAVMTCEAGVSQEFKRLIGYAASLTAGCQYCQAHTVLAADRFGSTDERLRQVCDFDNSAHFSAKEKAALRFARAAAAVPNAVDASIVADLKAHWDEGEIVEIMAVIALFGYLNRWNDSMASTLEPLPRQTGAQHLQASGWQVGKHD